MIFRILRNGYVIAVTYNYEIAFILSCDEMNKMNESKLCAFYIRFSVERVENYFCVILLRNTTT